MRVPAVLMSVLAIITAVSATAAAPADIRKELSSYMEARVRANDFSGTVLVKLGSERLLVQGYGLANREWAIPNTPTTRFRLGSLTKAFTATLILQLNERGEVNLNAGICSYLSSCPKAWQPVTVHQLLTHTGGIPSFTDDPEFVAEGRDPRRRTPDQLIALIKDRPLEFAPGSDWHYSNAGYYLLGRIIERVSGRSYETTVTEQIFQPLGMKSSGYDHADAILEQRASGYAVQDGRVINVPPRDVGWADAAGALYSTVLDLEKWDEALYSDRVLTERSRLRMWTPVRQHYGYGWGIFSGKDSTDGQLQITHDGGIDGFNAHISRFPQSRALVIVLANREDARANVVGQALASILFHQPYDRPVQPLSRVDRATLDRWVGTYEVQASGRWEVTRDGDRLVVRVPDISERQKFELTPVSPDRFRLEDLQVDVEFLSVAGGPATGIKVQQGEKTRSGARVATRPTR